MDLRMLLLGFMLIGSAAAESGKKKKETGTNEYELTAADYACAEDNNKYYDILVPKPVRSSKNLRICPKFRSVGNLENLIF